MSDYYDPTINLPADQQAKENRLVNVALSKLPQPYISGLKLKQDVKLGNLVLNRLDTNTGTVWVVTDIEGWWELPDPEFPDLARGWGDGSYDAKGRYASRILNLTGSILVQNPDQAVVARETLLSALDLVYKSTNLIVYEASQAKFVSVRLSGRPQIENVNARGRIDFSVGLKAADPIKYAYYRPSDTLPSGFTLTGEGGQLTRNLPVGTEIQITNTGNTPVPVYFSITGTGITAGGITNTYTNRLGQAATATLDGIRKDWSGGRLEIDTYDRTLLKVDSAGAATSGRAYAKAKVDWIELYPGINKLTFSSNGTSPACEIRFRSGWIG